MRSTLNPVQQLQNTVFYLERGYDEMQHRHDLVKKEGVVS